MHPQLGKALELSPEAGLIWLKGFLLLALGVVLVWLTIKSLVKHAVDGDQKSSISVVSATLICLIPLGLIGTTAIVTGYGGAILGVLTKILSA